MSGRGSPGNKTWHCLLHALRLEHRLAALGKELLALDEVIQFVFWYPQAVVFRIVSISFEQVVVGIPLFQKLTLYVEVLAEKIHVQGF